MRPVSIGVWIRSTVTPCQSMVKGEVDYTQQSALRGATFWRVVVLQVFVDLVPRGDCQGCRLLIWISLAWLSQGTTETMKDQGPKGSLPGIQVNSMPLACYFYGFDKAPFLYLNSTKDRLWYPFYIMEKGDQFVFWQFAFQHGTLQINLGF